MANKYEKIGHAIGYWLGATIFTCVTIGIIAITIKLLLCLF